MSYPPPPLSDPPPPHTHTNAHPSYYQYFNLTVENYLFVCVYMCVLGGRGIRVEYHFFEIVCVLRKNHLVVNDYVAFYGWYVPEKPSSPLTKSIVLISLHRVALLR